MLVGVLRKMLSHKRALPCRLVIIIRLLRLANNKVGTNHIGDISEKKSQLINVLENPSASSHQNDDEYASQTGFFLRIH